MTSSDNPDTPSQALARQIVERLVAEHLISPKAAAQLELLLATGKVRQEDWRLAIELGGDKEGNQ